jgi:hypothetical protein
MIRTYDIFNFKYDLSLLYQVSDIREVVKRFDDHAHLEVGGFVDSAGTHYARMKDDQQYILQGERFVIRAVIDLPIDFYSRQTASLKLLTCGNELPYQRMGLWIASDHLPRLQAERKGLSLKPLWKGDTVLPVGCHEYALEIIPSSVNGKALTRLHVDGIIWGESTVCNFIPGLSASSYIVNRIVFGMDGAAAQDDMRISLDFLSVSVAAEVLPPSPCTALKTRLVNVDASWTLTQTLAASLREQLAEAEATIRALASERSEILVEMKANECL